MYPDNPWKNISKEAILCIQHFLVVQHDERYTVEQALQDPWIQDFQCLLDIALLEEEANIGISQILIIRISINLGWFTVAHNNIRSGSELCGG